MAHNLRYYKELQHADGSAVRLEIHEKNGTAPAIEIGSVLQTLRLDIQGGTDTIDAPIVKTSLTMAFVDAPDITDGKCGNWQEFYTPDSTKWKVVVKAKIPGASYVTIWGGYITPDSYSEQLTYRGSVSIIARDNIGHMQDFPFDLAGNTDGMITLRELLDAAWAKIESPMQLDFWHQEQEANYLRCNGIDAIDTYLNVSAFKEMNFCEAVEKALYGYGLVLRYVGRNIVSVMSLRDLPLQGRLQPLTVLPTFLAGAERELAPAARRIEETAKYEFGTGVQALLATSIDFTGAAGTCAFYSTNIFGETTKVNIPVHPIANTNTSNEGWSNLASSTLFFNPNRYVIRDAQLIDDANRLLFLAANTDGSHWVAYRKSIYCSPFRWEMTFGRVVTRQGNDVSYCYGFASGNEDNGIGSIKVKEVTCYVSIEQNGSSKYYDGAEWQAEPYKIILQPEENKVSLDLGFKDITGNAMVAITVENIEIDSMRDYSNGSGMYVPIQSLNFVPTDALSLCETNTVNTNYVDTNNVIISRDPEIAPALNEVPFPNVIKNGIFVKSGNAYLPAKEWAWSGGTPQQMAVYNHLQLLCYHAKPNNVITGDIVNTDFVYLERLYRWNGEDHILISGSYNFIDGVIESAVLRSFAWYSDMWSDVTGIDDSLEQNSRTVAEGTGQSSASRSTYNNTATVNIGGGSSGGGSAEVTTLAELNDVNLVNLADGQSLVYDLAQGRWVNQKITVNYTLPLASSSVRGGVKVGFSAKYQNGSYYSIPVELDSEKAFVKLTKTMVSTALGFTPVSSADIEVTKAKVIGALGYTPFDAADFTQTNIVNALGFFPMASSSFNQDNIRDVLGISNWALASSKPSYVWSEIGSKPTTLSGYGITDAIRYENEIEPTTTGTPAVMGYRSSAGWKSGGPVMLWGKTGYYTRLNVSMEKSDSPKMYISNVYGNTEYDWALLLTDKSIGEHAIAIESDGNSLLVGDKKAKTGYVYGQNGWKAVGPAMTFAQGNYKGLLNMAMYNPATADNGVSAYLGVVYAGTQGKWSLILTEHNIGNYAALKATTLEGYGITDALVYQNGIDTASAYRHIGYGHATGGWRGSGPAMIFGVNGYRLALQCSIADEDYVALFVRQRYNGVDKEWDRILTEGTMARGVIPFDAQYYKCLGDIVIHRNSDNSDTFLNYGPSNTDGASLSVFGNNLRFYVGAASDYNVAMLLSPDKSATFTETVNIAGALKVAKNINSANYMEGGYLSIDPTSSFSTTIFGDTGTSVARMRLMRTGAAIDGIAAAYTPVLAMRAYDTHSFLAISYNNKSQCYIGGGTSDSVTWSAIMYHNNMDLVPKCDNSYSLGDASHRWKEVHAVSIKIGDAVISWDAVNERLVISKGIYSTGAITAGSKS